MSRAYVKRKLLKHSRKMVKQLHPTLNEGRDVLNYTQGSTKPVYFVCEGLGCGCAIKSCPNNVRRNSSKKILCYKCSTPNSFSQDAGFLKCLHPDEDYKKLLSRSEARWICQNPNCGAEHRQLVQRKYATWKRSGKVLCQRCTRSFRLTPISFAEQCPEEAKEWDYERNDCRPDQVSPNSGVLRHWICKEGHRWISSPKERALGKNMCSMCRPSHARVLPKFKQFLASVRPFWDTLPESLRYEMFEDAGFTNVGGKCQQVVELARANRLPLAEIDKFINDEPSEIDGLIKKPETANEFAFEKRSSRETDQKLSDAIAAPELPNLQRVLSTLDLAAARIKSDEKRVWFLERTNHDLWSHVVKDEKKAIKKIEKVYVGEGDYARGVRRRFFKEYNAVKKLKLPFDYVGPYTPKLEQLLIWYDVKYRNVGNWSGTGSGKTLGAILASRVTKKLTVVFCPNAVVEGFCDKIREAFPRSHVALGVEEISTKPNSYLVLNYEKLQQKKSDELVNALLKHDIGFIVTDEVQYVKNRSGVATSKRRRLLLRLRQQAATSNPDLRVLAMSATPVINDLEEPRGLLHFIRNENMNHLPTKPSVRNGMLMHQALMSNARRFMPDYMAKLSVRHVEVDCTDCTERFLTSGGVLSPLRVEQILTAARIPAILKLIKRREKVVVYTHYVRGIVPMLERALTKAGHKVGVFTGDDKTGLNEFLRGSANVLIGSACIGTGVDGLQKVCKKLIYNSLPWTNGEFMQINGRLPRLGQTSDKVEAIVVKTSGVRPDGGRWSWCDYRISILEQKRTLADTAVDGVVPVEKQRSPAKMAAELQAMFDNFDKSAAA